VTALRVALYTLAVVATLIITYGNYLGEVW
jgi:hypothetical protein